MTDRTHIQEIEEQAALFALGALEPEDARRFQERLAAGCPLCRSEVQECHSALLGVTLSATPVSPPPRLRARLMDRISKDEGTGSGQGTVVRAQDAPWKPSPFPGVDMRFLHERKTMLVRMAPNARIPAHPHSTAEQCLVLEGSITSEGVTVRAGDFIYMPPGSAHEDLYSDEGALFLITYA